MWDGNRSVEDFRESEVKVHGRVLGVLGMLRSCWSSLVDLLRWWRNRRNSWRPNVRLRVCGRGSRDGVGVRAGRLRRSWMTFWHARRLPSPAPILIPFPIPISNLRRTGLRLPFHVQQNQPRLQRSTLSHSQVPCALLPRNLRGDSECGGQSAARSLPSSSSGF